MNTGNPHDGPDKHPLVNLMFKGHLAITVRVIGTTVVIMAALGGAGYLLDKALNTQPILMVAGIVIAFPIIQFVIYKTFRNVTNKLRKDK